MSTYSNKKEFKDLSLLDAFLFALAKLIAHIKIASRWCASRQWICCTNPLQIQRTPHKRRINCQNNNKKSIWVASS